MKLLLGSLLVSTALQLASAAISCTDTCADPSFCSPITKPLPEKETLLFTTLSSDVWKSLDFSKVTTLAIFGNYDDTSVASVTCLAHQHNVRVVIGSEFPMDDIDDDEAMAKFVDSKVEEAKRLGLDGLNFDNEGLRSTADILAKRIKEVRAAFNAEFETPQISFDLSIFPKDKQGDGYDYTAMNEDLDFQLPMGYDMNWNTDIATGNSPIESDKAGLQQYIDLGVPANNVVLGLPWYGWAYKCVNATDFTAPCTLQDFETDWFGEVAFQWGNDEITDKWNEYNQPTVSLDEATMTKYFSYVDRDSGDIMQLWYDDEETLAEKYKVVEEGGFRGIAIWTIDMIKTKSENYDAMWDALPTRQL
eukprot:CAMPEP_0118656894 /NCGR_PEP_ID=MMETSP0785-20121206/13722_1 /TAXON_ID=91992 /ORGANISM="Bolidomonas pacifica, Strain CCMP 1866" /LENGTH=361 /DNA_ID=CAMNT_0006549763 /DNA_START=1 /DNA_END=1086 /DNA_ORIENTATION=+